ncbi:MAG: pyruvate kinase, partial [Nanoarchaeota archaeon]|nr:pyruvate kinase [Nanoarchaeota archaeon]
MKTKTKIVATIGPASDHLVTLKKMKENGMDVARI